MCAHACARYAERNLPNIHDLAQRAARASAPRRRTSEVRWQRKVAELCGWLALSGCPLIIWRYMRLFPKPALLWAFCVLPLGCTSAGSEDAGADPALSSLALFSLERSVDGDAEGARLAANAKVARFRGIDGDGLLKVLGAEPRELESCGTVAALDEGVLSPLAQVDLLSVGAIELSLADYHHSLAPRLFPALATAAGWFYAGAAELPAQLAGTEEPFVLSAAGQAGLGKFELHGATPKEVLGLALGGAPVQAGSVLSRAQSLEFTWEPSSSADRIEFEIFAAGSTLSCAARDDGHFRISSAQLKLLEADESAALIVKRVRTVPVEMTGVESAYARLAVTRSVSLRVE
jgi:hypothetical protein